VSTLYQQIRSEFIGLLRFASSTIALGTKRFSPEAKIPSKICAPKAIIGEKHPLVSMHGLAVMAQSEFTAGAIGRDHPPAARRY
jgi:hypothetical protein